MTTETFTDNLDMQHHAQAWADQWLPRSVAQDFVPWLMCLDADEQAFVCEVGYPAIRARFESDMANGLIAR